jgi:hypothetical protein
MKEFDTKKYMKIETEGTASHTDWHQFYNVFSSYRDECLKLGMVVFGANQEKAVGFLQQYVSSIYSMAQQVFSFYSVETEKKITEEWLELLEEVNGIIFLFQDKDFKNQYLSNGEHFIDRDMKMKLIMFYNKIDRLAAEAGLLVGKDKKDVQEPKRGLMGI